MTPALVWDARHRGDARAFLAPAGLAGAAASLPVPCRLLRAPCALLEGLAPAADVTRADGPACAVLAGTAAALAAATAGFPRLEEALAAYARPASRLCFGDGVTWDLRGRTRIMAILNVTPDSFSDGGRYDAPQAAAERAAALLEQGADVIDVGGESTRPGAAAVSTEEETRRVVSALSALRRALPEVRVSVDTRRAAVAAAALEAGADMINDVSALADPDMAPLAAAARCPVLLMHMRGTPQTMQADTHYDDLLGEVAAGLAAAALRAREAGVRDDRIALDPGLGFGKSAEGNELLLRELRALSSLGYPVAVGASRKMFIGLRTGVSHPASRTAGSVAAAVAASLAGAALVRVHDVAATREALAVADAIRAAGSVPRC